MAKKKQPAPLDISSAIRIVLNHSIEKPELVIKAVDFLEEKSSSKPQLRVVRTLLNALDPMYRIHEDHNMKDEDRFRAYCHTMGSITNFLGSKKNAALIREHDELAREAVSVLSTILYQPPTDWQDCTISWQHACRARRTLLEIGTQDSLYEVKKFNRHPFHENVSDWDGKEYEKEFQRELKDKLAVFKTCVAPKPTAAFKHSAAPASNKTVWTRDASKS